MLEKRTIFAIIISFFIFFHQAYIPNSVNATENHLILHQQLNQLLKNENDLNGAIAGISIRSGLSGQLI
ncbi:hypothetical protein [Bacillus sp. EB600]|uniref:hypothetical protein n=1 Tax=Bacillus sp. EB600 TaxID=2806345 RepID=UPI00210A3810|nr:hypothetical protein [Bacillus sp. EB600]MCQ6280334.1 hypothetical protein [Bacillus sp. EB600]